MDIMTAVPISEEFQGHILNRVEIHNSKSSVDVSCWRWSEMEETHRRCKLDPISPLTE